MKVLIFGSTGLFGVSFIFRYYNVLDITAVVNKKNIKVDNVKTIKISSNSLSLNIDELEKIIIKNKPEVVINAAALTNIEFCENQKIETFNVNTELAGKISHVCFGHNIKFIHISTDSLFKGDKEYMDETLNYDPQNIYALSKANAEKLILSNNPNSLILRTSFYGWGPPSRQSLSDWIINSLRSKKEINCYTNIFFTPILTIDFSDIMLKLIKSNAHGIFNISCDKKISKYQFAIDLARTLNLDEDLIKPIEYNNNLSVKRPLDLSLSNNKLKKIHQIQIKSINNQILQLKENEQKIKKFYEFFSIE